MRKLFTLALAAAFCVGFLACAAEEEKTEVPSAQGQIDKAQAAADAASQAARRTDQTSAAADGADDNASDDADSGDGGGQ